MQEKKDPCACANATWVFAGIMDGKQRRITANVC
jgi:hypothetical protein